MIGPLRGDQAISGAGGRITQVFHQWLRSLALTLQITGVPLRGVVPVALTSAEITLWFDSDGLGKASGPFRGWGICNGNDGRPDLDGKFLRFSTSVSGGTGGSDSSAHTHALDHDHGSFTSGSESAHTHAIDHNHGAFTSGSESAHTHSTPAHAHQTEIGWDGTSVYMKVNGSSQPASGSIVENPVDRIVFAHGAASASLGARLAQTRTDGSGTSGAGSSHSHSVDVPALTGASGAGGAHSHAVDVPAFTGTSGAASATDNRPAYYELVPVMRVE